MRIFYLGHKVTTWVGRDRIDHLGQTQVITSCYLGQSYYLDRNNSNWVKNVLFITVREERYCISSKC